MKLLAAYYLEAAIALCRKIYSKKEFTVFFRQIVRSNVCVFYKIVTVLGLLARIFFIAVILNTPLSSFI